MANLSDKLKKNRKWVLFSGCAVLLACAVVITGVFFMTNRLGKRVPPAPAEVTASILTQMEYTDMVAVQPDQLSKHYDIPEGVVADSSVYMSKSPESAAELSCFLLADEARFQELQTAVTNHLNSKSNGFRNLNPTQYDALQNAAVVRKGRYVLVAVSCNSAAETELFLKMF